MTISILRTLAIAAGLCVAAPALAQQTYLPPETDARREMVTDNPYAGGQPSDLTFKVESVEFIGPPCTTGEKDILHKAKVIVEVGWIKSISYFGVLAIQAEGSDSTDGDDQLVIEFNGRGRWTLASLTRDGTDCFGGASPEALNGGNGTWDGVKLTPPSSFETGKYGSGSEPKQTMRYTFTFDYHPLPGDLCKCVGFLLRGYYLHTYDGAWTFLPSNAISVSATFPWSVGLGGSVSLTNDHAWQKQLVNPRGTDPNHTASFDPPGNWVPAEECCAVVSAPVTPDTTIDDLGLVPTRDAHVVKALVSLVAPGVESTIDGTLEITALTPGRVELSRTTLPVTLGPDSIEVEVPVTLPATYPFDEVIVHATAYAAIGPATSAETSMSILVAAQVPQISAASMMPDGRLLVRDVLFVNLFDPALPMPQWAMHTQITVFDQFGTVRDQEQGIFSGNPQWQIQMQVQSALTLPVVPFNGKLSAATGDTIVASYASAQGALINSIAVNASPIAIVRSAAAQPSSEAVLLAGTSTGQNWLIQLLFDNGTSIDVGISMPPGMRSVGMTSALAAALGGAGLAVGQTNEGALFVIGPANLLGIKVSASDPGADLIGAEGPAPFTSDLNGDGTVDAIDLGILLGAWGTAAADIDGNGTTDGADLAILLGAFS